MRGLAASILLAGLAAPAVLAAPSPGRTDAYVLAVGDSWTSGDVDLDELAGMRERFSGDFLWVRRGGTAYRVDDPSILKRAEACFEPLRALEPEMEKFRQSERQFDSKDEALDREQDDVEQDLEDLDVDEEAGLSVDAMERDELERRRDAVQARQEELRKEQRVLESVERDLDAREEALEAEAEGRLWRLIDETIASGAAKKLPRR